MDERQAAQHPEDFVQELHEARKIQLGMLPQSAPEIPGFQIAAHSTPAVAVSGDFYDFIPLSDDKVGIVIGDAVGHGIAAALLMTMTLTNFRSLAPRDISAADVFNGVNLRLTQGMKMRTFITCIYAVLDPATSRLTCAMAGMQPWLIKAKSRECLHIKAPGAQFPLGVSQKSEYQSCEVEMEAGDTLVLYTDGIPEALNAESEFYSFERLESALVKNSGAEAQEILDSVLADVQQYAGDCPQEDDITMVVLKAAESLATAPVVSAAQPVIGERREVTTLFAVADKQMSPDLTEQARVLIQKHGGIPDTMNDNTVVALFGVPILHKDDVERAVAVAQAIQELQSSPMFRIGISTGTATVRTDEDVDYREAGETVNSALQLANAAEPGQTLVSENVHRHSHGAFRFGTKIPVKFPFDDEAITAYKQEWKEFGCMIGDMVKEATQLAHTGKTEDWKGFGKKIEDEVVSQMASTLGVQLDAEKDKTADKTKLEDKIKAQLTDIAGAKPDADWDEIGKQLEAKIKSKIRKWLKEK